ncbi:MAG: MobC family plasmid mobilization relaxosome protein [Duncaniella sp.]|nr:MobC family plasmid mobilization relaxosome protein [Duncaniella sp.]
MDNPQTPPAKKNQGGRPKLPEKEKRNCMVKVYFDAVNYAKLLRKHKRTGVSLSTLVYELAVNGYVKEPISMEVATDLRRLSGMANNLNQLAHEAHKYSFPSVEKMVTELAQKIDKIIINISQK